MNELTPPRDPRHPAPASPRYYGPSSARSEDVADGLSLRSMLVVLRRYWWLLVLTTLAAGGLAFLHGLRADPAFKATATVVIEDSRQAIAGNLVGAAAERGGRSDPFASQLEILRSHAVLGAAVDQAGMRLWPLDREVFGLRLRDLQVREGSSSGPIRLTFGRDGYIAEHGETIAEARYGEAVSLPPASFAVEAPPVSGHEDAEFVIVGQRAAALFLRGRVDAARRGATNLVDVSVTAADPLTAQVAVNALVTAFANHSEAMARQASERRREFLREQLTSTDARLADVQRELIDFRRRERVFSSREQFAAEQAGLMTLELNREQLLTDRQMFGQLLEGVRQAEPGETVDRLHALVSLPEIASNPVVSELYRQLVEYERERNNMTSGRWSRAESNPDVERLDGLIAATTSRMATGVQSHLRSLDARIAALDRVRGQRVASIQERPETEAEESHLVQQVEAVRGVADQLRSEYQRAQIAAAVEGGEIQIVDFADVPGGPIGSGALRLVIMGLAAGLLPRKWRCLPPRQSQHVDPTAGGSRGGTSGSSAGGHPADRPSQAEAQSGYHAGDSIHRTSQRRWKEQRARKRIWERRITRSNRIFAYRSRRCSQGISLQHPSGSSPSRTCALRGRRLSGPSAPISSSPIPPRVSEPWS
jgi:uncharacterized protein involved in exopolysaccharide biosynthesis